MDAINHLLKKGIQEIIEKESLVGKLKSGQKLRIKHGIDPTGGQIHLGRAVALRKLKEFQDLGHKIVLIIGDFTAQIGDPSDKLQKRPFLTKEQVKENLKNYLPQIGKILDVKKTEVRYNSEWLAKLGFQEISRLAEVFTLQQMIERRNFKLRLEKNEEIGLRELFYPLMQGYDSVAVKADVEIGGEDQLFNLLAGREIQKRYGQKSQDILTVKMLLGLDGRKMSTSWGNVVNISDAPSDMYGKIMSMNDELMPSYYELATDIDFGKKQPPRDAKAKLAKEIVRIYHGEKSAEKAEEEFNKVFREKKMPDEMVTAPFAGKKMNAVDLLIKSKLVSSKSEARRLIDQGGVKIEGVLQKDWEKEVKLEKGAVIQVGKRRFVKIV